MSNTGGGLLTNGRTQQAPPEMNMPQVSAPRQAQSAPQQMPQGGPPQGAPQPQAPGAPQGAGPPGQSGGGSVSDLSLTLLHDPQIGPEYQKLIAQGPEAAAQVAVQLYEKVVEGFQGQGQQIDETEGAEAAEIVMEDIAAMGVGMTAQQQADAAQQAQEQFEQQAFQQTEAGRRSQQELDVQAFQAGESARQQAAQMGMTAQQQEDAARQAQEQFRQSAFQQTEAGRRSQQELDVQAFQAGESARQQAAQMGLSAQQQEEALRRDQHHPDVGPRLCAARHLHHDGAAVHARDPARFAEGRVRADSPDACHHFAVDRRLRQDLLERPAGLARRDAREVRAGGQARRTAGDPPARRARDPAIPKKRIE